MSATMPNLDVLIVPRDLFNAMLAIMEQLPYAQVRDVLEQVRATNFRPQVVEGEPPAPRLVEEPLA